MRRRIEEFDYINQYYGLNLYRGIRLTMGPNAGTAWANRSGQVASGDGNYLMIKFDGDSSAIGPFHPTDEIIYEDSPNEK